MDEEATDDRNLLEDILEKSVPASPVLSHESYLLHSWHAVEEKDGEDASRSSESACEATAKEMVSGLVVKRLGIARMFEQLCWQ